jgi:hypothetical protein
MIRNELTMQSASRISSDSESGSFFKSTIGLFHPRDSDLICDRKETASSPCVKTTARVSRGFEEARKKSSISQPFSTGARTADLVAHHDLVVAVPVGQQQ